MTWLGNKEDKQREDAEGSILIEPYFSSLSRGTAKGNSRGKGRSDGTAHTWMPLHTIRGRELCGRPFGVHSKGSLTLWACPWGLLNGIIRIKFTKRDLFICTL